MMIKLYRGDCIDIMPSLQDKSIDMILCDLPYGTTACKWDQVIPFEKLWPEYKRLIKDNGAIVLFGSEPFSSVMRMSNLEMYRYDWIWEKSKPVGFINAKKRPLKNIETVSVFYLEQSRYIPQGIIKCNRTINNSTSQIKHGKITAINGGAFKQKYFKQNYTNYPRQILKYKVEQGLHPTQKPVALLEYLIKTYTLECETILDNTMGSGSTGVACVNTNCNFIGIEKDCPKDGDKHFRTAIRRITEAGGRGIEVFE